MTYLPNDDQLAQEVMIEQLFQETHAVVDEYSRYVEVEGAEFMREHVVSLKQDLERAMQDGEERRVRLVCQELRMLCHELQRQITVATRRQTELVVGLLINGLNA